MRLVVAKDYDDMSRKAANIIAANIAKNIAAHPRKAVPFQCRGRTMNFLIESPSQRVCPSKGQKG